jgi:UTP--glucose-1-phosphate uridylyltransferase
MPKIRKAVIPVAGYGTRFLPATKAMPKEMMPIIDKPVIQYIVEEAVASGIEDIILVTGPSKRAIEDHFDYNYELQSWLKKQGKEELRKELKAIADMANFIYIRQKGPYGNGTPVLNAKKIIGNEPFAVIWGDEFFLTNGKPRIKQIMDVYDKYQDPVLTAMPIKDEDTKKYGVIEGVKVEDKVFQVKKLIEKPGPDKTKSRIGSMGGYILTPDIFEALENTKRGKDGEIWLVDAIFKLSKKRPLYACLVDGTYYDAGSKFGWIKANIDLALERQDLKQEVTNYIKSLKTK